MKNIFVIVGIMTLITFVIFGWIFQSNIANHDDANKPDEQMTKCLSWTEYDSGNGAWRWMSASAVELGKGGLFPSRQAAIDNCVATLDTLDIK